MMVGEAMAGWVVAEQTGCTKEEIKKRVRSRVKEIE
jgi:hypothetical protein